MRIIRRYHLCAFVDSVFLGVALFCASRVCVATLFRCAPPSALACRATLCAMLCALLCQQRMAATVTRATATLFHGDQIPATSKALRCRDTPVGGAGSKHPGPTNENCAHFSSHLTSCVHHRRLYGPGVVPPCVAVMHVALRSTMHLSITPLYDALYCCAGCVSRCVVCCSALCCSVLVCSLSCIVVVRAAWRGPTALSASYSLKVSGGALRLSGLGDHWVTVCPAVRPRRSLLAGPRLCAPPAASPHVCSTPHAGGSYTAGCTLRWPRCAPGPPAS